MNDTNINHNNFNRQLLKLSIPIIIQNLLSAAVSSCDVVMLNYVGQSSISAVSLAANYSNVLFMVYYGVGTGASLLCAQYFGKKDLKAIHIIEGIALRFSLVISLLVALIAFTMPDKMMQIFTSDPELIRIGASYLRIMGITYLCWSITEVYLSILRSIGRVTVCMILNLLAFVLNIILNAVFIFGLFGAPKLGAAGVAIATASSRLVELLGCFIISFFSKDVRLNPRFIFVRSKSLLKDFIRLSLPALGNDVSWGVGFAMYSVILGSSGFRRCSCQLTGNCSAQYRFRILLWDCQCRYDHAWKNNGRRKACSVKGICFPHAEGNCGCKYLRWSGCIGCFSFDHAICLSE